MRGAFPTLSFSAADRQTGRMLQAKGATMQNADCGRHAACMASPGVVAAADADRGVEDKEHQGQGVEDQEHRIQVLAFWWLARWVGRAASCG